MTGKEALDVLKAVTSIHNHLIKGHDRSAFYDLGVLSEKLSFIVRIDEASFHPTVQKEED